MPHKRVLHVVNVYFAVPYFFGNQFRYFKEKGYEMHLICSPDKRLKQYAESQGGIEYAEIPITRAISPITDIRSIYSVCKYIKRHQIDTIVGHTVKGGFIAGIAGRLMGVKNIIHFRHGIPYDRNTGLKKLFDIWRTRFIAACAHKVVCVSPSLAQLSTELKLNSPRKQYVLGRGTCGGIDTRNKFNPQHIDVDKLNSLHQRWGIKPDDFVIGYCGRIEADKGIAELLGAFKLLKGRHPNRPLKLLLVGPFDERSSLSITEEDKQLLKQGNNGIIHTGYITTDLEYYYAMMDICVLPSYHEGFGMCMVEAQSMGKPVLTTRSYGCIDSIIPEQTGFYVDITPESIAQGVEKYFDNERRYTMGRHARTWATENFDNLVIWPHIEKLL